MSLELFLVLGKGFRPTLGSFFFDLEYLKCADSIFFLPLIAIGNPAKDTYQIGTKMQKKKPAGLIRHM